MTRVLFLLNISRLFSPLASTIQRLEGMEVVLSQESFQFIGGGVKRRLHRATRRIFSFTNYKRGTKSNSFVSNRVLERIVDIRLSKVVPTCTDTNGVDPFNYKLTGLIRKLASSSGPVFSQYYHHRRRANTSRPIPATASFIATLLAKLAN